jgi:hypothetical protein
MGKQVAEALNFMHQTFPLCPATPARVARARRQNHSPRS